MKKLLTALLAGLCLPLCGCSEKEVEEIVSEVSNAVTGEMDFSGNWTDADDENMTMIITAADAENEYDIIAYLGKTASEAESWTMHGTYNPETGECKYENGSYAVLKMNPDGNETRENEETVSGEFIKLGEDNFIWTDTKVEARVMQRDANPDTVYTIPMAEGPFVVNETFNPIMSEEDTALFEEGVRGQIGVEYKPVQLLATQVVNGTNSMYLAYATYALPKEPVNTYAIVIVYTDTDGGSSAEVINILDVNDVKTLEELSETTAVGGWTIQDNDGAGITTDEADEAFMNAFNSNYAGDLGKLVTIALLGRAEENDEVTYRYLARGTTEKLDPEKALFLIDVKKAADGTCTVEDAKPFDLAAYTQNGANN